jgi:YebC/PmpR family DNA-binding regulatory protein
MAGHSKWANIKHKKAAEDQKRGKQFSKISRGIRQAVREGGSGDPETNASLRIWLDKAKEVNLPKDNIKRAIDAGLGIGDAGQMQEVVYEGFGPQGVGVMVVCLTDNKNRTTADVRYAFNSMDGSLGAPGSVKYMFTRDDKGNYACKMPIPIQDESQRQKIQQLVDNLLELEDVESVYCATENIQTK